MEKILGGERSRRLGSRDLQLFRDQLQFVYKIRRVILVGNLGSNSPEHGQYKD